MKYTQTPILAIALAAFALAITTPVANAIPPLKVPGTAYQDGRFDNPGPSSCTRCGKKIEKCSDCSSCDDCRKKENSDQKDKREPYWKRKTGGSTAGF